MRTPNEKLAAFHRFDRLCRIASPATLDLAGRVDMLDALGMLQAAGLARARVEGANTHDVRTLRWLIAHHTMADGREAAARALLDADRAGAADAGMAVAHLIARGESSVLRAVRRGTEIAGWIAWRGGDAPSLVARDAGRAAPVQLFAEQTGSDSDAIRVAHFAFGADPAVSVELEATDARGATRRGVVYPTARPRLISPLPPRQSADLTVLIPVFGDPDSLGRCLDAIRPQCGVGVKVIVIDDASPDPRVSALAESFCESMDGELIRSRVNAGFAAAVNAGLDRCRAGDVLILNSDVILPVDALGRLRRAARSAPDIGTVTPLSNDAGPASFPDPLGAGPALDDVERAQVDAAARDANDGVTVDLLAALGSCLYVTRACLDRVGALSLRYGRGYYEDVELYLHAGERGLRNVAACDVYVTHLGGRSFGADKRALVTRNHAILCGRFPGFERSKALFDAADPLRAARAAIEERLGPDPRTATIFVAPAFGSEATLDRAIGDCLNNSRPSLILRHAAQDGGTLVAVGAQGAPWPLSLTFHLTEGGGDSARLTAYLCRIEGAEVVALDPERLPDALLDVLHRVGWPIGVEGEGSASTAAPAHRSSDTAGGAARRSGAGVSLGAAPDPARPRSGLDPEMAFVLDERAIVTLDAEAPPSAQPLASPKGIDRRGRTRTFHMLGVVAPEVDPSAEAFVLALARWMRRSTSTRLIVLGRAVDEEQLRSSGNVWVTGRLERGEIADLARIYGVDALLSPYRHSGVRSLTGLQGSLGLPAAFFDAARWKGAIGRDDLPLDPFAPERDSCSAVAAWCGLSEASP